MTDLSTSDELKASGRIPGGCPVIHLDASPALEVGSHHIIGSTEDDSRNANFRASTQEFILLDERTQHFSVETHSTDLEAGVLGLHIPSF